MDNLTHTLFAATLARTPLGRAGRGTTAALIIASNAPDIDIVTTARGAVSYLRWHRGPTHGPLGIVGLAFFTAAIVSLAYRLSARLKPRAPDEHGRAPLASFGMLATVSMIGTVTHVLMDLPTSYGTHLLSPFDWHWFAVDWMPIIDVWLIGLLAAGLWFGSASAEAGRWNAAIVLALMSVNYGVRAVAHHQALAIAPHLLGPALPQACDPPTVPSSILDSWPPERARAPRPLSGTQCLIEMAAMPTFLSPFRWRIVEQLSNAYEIHDIDLVDARFRAPASDTAVRWRLVRRYPNVWTPAVERAATTPVGQVFLGFARFPVARSFVDQRGIVTVRWDDIRFVGETVVLDQPRRTLLTAIVRIGPDGQILQESVGR